MGQSPTIKVFCPIFFFKSWQGLGQSPNRTLRQHPNVPKGFEAEPNRTQIGGLNMFENIVPKFQKGRILKNKVLETLRDFPMDSLRIAFNEYSDGVVFGGNILVNKEILTVQPSILKFKGRLYLIEHEYSLEYFPTDNWTAIYAKFIPETNHADYDSCLIKIEFNDDLTPKKDCIELARFKLRQGAWLRYDYQDLEDFTTEYNTFNYVHAPYAAPKESTICPELIQYFAKQVLFFGSQNPLDLSFSLDALNAHRITRESILYYISNKLNETYRTYSNVEIHKKLILILKDIERNALPRKRPPKESDTLMVE